MLHRYYSIFGILRLYYAELYTDFIYVIGCKRALIFFSRCGLVNGKTHITPSPSCAPARTQQPPKEGENVCVSVYFEESNLYKLSESRIMTYIENVEQQQRFHAFKHKLFIFRSSFIIDFLNKWCLIIPIICVFFLAFSLLYFFFVFHATFALLRTQHHRFTLTAMHCTFLRSFLRPLFFGWRCECVCVRIVVAFMENAFYLWTFCYYLMSALMRHQRYLLFLLLFSSHSSIEHNPWKPLTGAYTFYICDTLSFFLAALSVSPTHNAIFYHNVLSCCSLSLLAYLRTMFFSSCNFYLSDFISFWYRFWVFMAVDTLLTLPIHFMYFFLFVTRSAVASFQDSLLSPDAHQIRDAICVRPRFLSFFSSFCV